MHRRGGRIGRYGNVVFNLHDHFNLDAGFATRHHQPLAQVAVHVDIVCRRHLRLQQKMAADHALRQPAAGP